MVDIETKVSETNPEMLADHESSLLFINKDSDEIGDLEAAPEGFDGDVEAVVEHVGEAGAEVEDGGEDIAAAVTTEMEEPGDETAVPAVGEDTGEKVTVAAEWEEVEAGVEDTGGKIAETEQEERETAVEESGVAVAEAESESAVEATGEKVAVAVAAVEPVTAVEGTGEAVVAAVEDAGEEVATTEREEPEAVIQDTAAAAAVEAEPETVVEEVCEKVAVTEPVVALEDTGLEEPEAATVEKLGAAEPVVSEAAAEETGETVAEAKPEEPNAGAEETREEVAATETEVPEAADEDIGEEVAAIEPEKLEIAADETIEEVAATEPPERENPVEEMSKNVAETDPEEPETAVKEIGEEVVAKGHQVAVEMTGEEVAATEPETVVIETEEDVGATEAEGPETAVTETEEVVVAAETDDLPHRTESSIIEVSEPKTLVQDPSHPVSGEAMVTDTEPKAEIPGSAVDGDKSEAITVKKQSFYMIRVPRFSDDELRTNLQHARLQVEEKTRNRDSIRLEIQNKKSKLNDHRQVLDAARAEERAARAAVTANYQEMEVVQLKINKIWNASSICEVSDKIRKLEHSLQHESNTLSQEKQYIADLKKLRQHRVQLSANIGPQEEIQQAFDQRAQIEEQLKALKKELDPLRIDVKDAESKVKAARKKFDDELQLLRGLQEQCRIADDLRQKAYGHMYNLKKASFEKSKYFNMYKDDQQAALKYASAGDRESLEPLCSKQVEKIMELWNTDEEFRRQYVKSNSYSTLRRLGTMDGRSLGPDEERPLLSNNVDQSSRNITLPSTDITTPAPVLVAEVTEGKLGVQAVHDQMEKKNRAVKLKVSRVPRETTKTIFSENNDIEEVEKERKPTKDEEELIRQAEELVRKEGELARKEEELRKEQAAAELKEQCRLEQRAKAKEAEERKRRKAEKARAKAENKALKEAELREKKRAKKEKKIGSEDGTTEATEGDNDADTEPLPPITAKELEPTVMKVAKRLSREHAAVKKLDKIQPLPMPLRNKGRRKTGRCISVLLATMLILVLFVAGHYVPHISLPSFGFQS